MAQTTLEIIDEASARYGLPPEWLRGIADIETGGKFNADAQNPNSSAGGLFQFIDTTWAQYGNGANKHDAYASTDAAARLLLDNRNELKAKLGRDPSGPELYLAHQQGSGGAVSLLADPSARAADIVGYDAVALNGGSSDMTAGDFAAIWTNDAATRMGKWAGDGTAYVPQYTSDTEVFKANQKTGEQPDYWNPLTRLGIYKDAISEEWAASWALTQMGQEDFMPDRNFQYSDDLYAKLTEGVPEEYASMLEEAVSEKHAYAIRGRIDEMLDTDKRLSDLGMTGAAVRVGAALADPIAIGASILTEGYAAPAIFGAKATRLGRSLRAGVAASAVNMGIEGAIAYNDPTRGTEDVLVAGIVGMGLGGALGAISRGTAVDRELAAAARKALPEFNAAGGARSAGAAQVVDGSAVDPRLSMAEAQAANAISAPTSAYGKYRFDAVGTLKQSPNPITRKLAGLLAEDGVANADNSVMVRSAEENVGMGMKTRMTEYYRTVEPLFKNWAKSQGIPFYKRGLHREKFFEEVGKGVRRPDGFFTNDPNIAGAVAHQKKLFNDLLKWAQDKGVAGFQNVKENSEYFTRIFNNKRLDEMFAKTAGNTGHVYRLFANAIVKGSDGIEYDDALEIATAYLKSVRKLKYQQVSYSRAISGDDIDTLTRILEEESGLSPERLASITADLQPKATNAGDTARTQRRMRLDETYRDAATGLGIEDVLENNAEAVMNLYTRQVMGAAYIEEALMHFRVPDVAGNMPSSAPTFDTVLNHIRDTADQHGLTPEQFNTEMKNLDFLYRAISGMPLHETTNLTEALRFMSNYNFVRIMNQAGFAQLAEIGNILGKGGWKATVQHVPALRSIWKRAQNGQMEDELFDEIETIWGLGTERMRHVGNNKMDDYGVFEGGNLGRAFRKADDAMQMAKRVTADVSFMAPINMALQRFAGRVAVQKFMNEAVTGGVISADRLAVLGIDGPLFERVKGQLLKHVTTREGSLGKTVRRVNFEQWDDQDAASAFINGIDRYSRRIIQENGAGMQHRWMSHPMGRTMFQFRSFVAGAYTKQLLSGLHHRDLETVSSWLLSMFFGGLSYVGSTYINTIGSKDRQRLLTERLSPEAIGAASFSRAGFASFLPGAADSMLKFAGYEPVFSFGRTTGLASDFFFGNPTIDAIDRAWAGGSGALKAATSSDYDFSQQDYNKVKGLVFFQNATLVRNFLNSFGDTLPRYSE